MTPRSLQVAIALLLASLPALLPAQEISGMEEERMKALEARNAQAEQWFGPRNKVLVAFRLLSSGGRVDFGNLGAVQAKFIAPASFGAIDRVYDTGSVSADGLRTDEVDPSGNQTSPQGGRYPTFTVLGDGTTEQSGDSLSYTPGRTRTWQALFESTAKEPGYLGFTNYSTTSEGGHFTDKPGPSAGVELSFSRDLGRLSRRIQWGFTTGVVLNGISSKSVGSVISTLNSRTDFYQIIGATDVGPIPTSAPGENVYENPVSHNVYLTGTETTIPLSQTPDESLTKNSSLAGGATVTGRWQIKGAYFMVKVGPSFRTQFNDRWELSGSAGYAGAYTGTTYTAAEKFTLDALPNVDLGVADPEVSTMTKFLSGYYADLTLEWAPNETTGLFGGLTAQQLGDYDQKVAERTAHIDLGSAVGVRGGISIKF